jgi:hypothetical protein
MIEQVSRIPLDFRLGTRSMIDLIKESGYLENAALLTVDSIEPFLRGNPPLVNAWLSYSEDKRSSRGWYVLKIGSNDEYEVGYLPDGERLRFVDSVRAAAEFIVRELQDIRNYIA